jgi:hypothetical protein
MPEILHKISGIFICDTEKINYAYVLLTESAF